MDNRTATREDGRTVYTGRIFSLDLDRVRLPGGQVIEMEVVRHPGSVVLLPMPSPGEIVLIRQFRYAVNRWLWELPAGSLEPGEDPAAAAARECEEEIGWFPERVERLRAFYPTPGFCDEDMVFFRCSDLRQPSPDSQAKKDDDEDLEPRTFSLTEAREMLGRGEIVDMKTAVGLCLFTAGVAGL